MEHTYMAYPLMNNHFLPILIITSFLTIGLGFIVLFFVAQTKLRKIETHLNKCRWVNDTYRIWGGGEIVGKIHRIGIIYSIYLFPRFWHRKQIIDLEQVLSLPRNLRLWIQIPYTIMIAAALVLVGIQALEP